MSELPEGIQQSEKVAAAFTRCLQLAENRGQETAALHLYDATKEWVEQAVEERIREAVGTLAGELDDEAASIEAERKRQAESAPGTTAGFRDRALAESRQHAASRIRDLLASLNKEGDGDGSR